MQALMIAAPMLGLIGLGVAGVGLFGRDPQAEEHDLSDYHEPAQVDARRSLAPMPQLCSSPDCPACADDDLPPAPPGMNAGSPLYAGMLFDTWYPESPAQVAARFLREIAAVEQDKAGIGPAHDHWVHWDGSCEMDCPGCARDMTGAFPVVRAA